MQYTEKELTQLIEIVEKEFTTHLAKAEGAVVPTASSDAPLAKAEEKKEEKKEAKQEEKKEEQKDASQEAPKAEAKADEAKPDEKQAEKPAEQKEEAPKAEAKADEDHCDYDEEDLEHMHKMYMSMSKGELKAHHDSVRKALDGHMQKCGDVSMTKNETNTSVQTQAIEVKIEDTQKTQELELAKSEAAGYKTKVEELQKSLDTVQEFLTKLVKKVPQGKAITSLEAITKSESASESKELSKSEVSSILAKKAADPSLAKSDRDAINAFYLNGTNINTISHLLK